MNDWITRQLDENKGAPIAPVANRINADWADETYAQAMTQQLVTRALELKERANRPPQPFTADDIGKTIRAKEGTNWPKGSTAKLVGSAQWNADSQQWLVKANPGGGAKTVNAQEWELDEAVATAPPETPAQPIKVTALDQLDAALANEAVVELPDGKKVQIKEERALGSRPEEKITEFVLHTTYPSGTQSRSQGSVLNPQSFDEALKYARQAWPEKAVTPSSTESAPAPVPMPQDGWRESPIKIKAYAIALKKAGYIQDEATINKRSKSRNFLAWVNGVENQAFRKLQPAIGTQEVLDQLAQRVVKEGMSIGQLHVIVQPFEDATHGAIKMALQRAGATPKQLEAWGYEGMTEAPAKPADYGANNTLVTTERANEVRKKLKAKLGQLNAGIDPELLALGTELAAYHLEASARKFVEFAQAMAADLDTTVEKIKPFLRAWYNGARDMMEDSGLDV